VPKCGRLKDLIGALSIACSSRDIDEMLMVVEVCCVLSGFHYTGC
jgi:ubiquitin carboxyl-terminal hydrolase 4/11/15